MEMTPAMRGRLMKMSEIIVSAPGQRRIDRDARRTLLIPRYHTFANLESRSDHSHPLGLARHVDPALFEHSRLIDNQHEGSRQVTLHHRDLRHGQRGFSRSDVNVTPTSAPSVNAPSGFGKTARIKTVSVPWFTSTSAKSNVPSLRVGRSVGPCQADRALRCARTVRRLKGKQLPLGHRKFHRHRIHAHQRQKRPRLGAHQRADIDCRPTDPPVKGGRDRCIGQVSAA